MKYKIILLIALSILVSGCVSGKAGNEPPTEAGHPADPDPTKQAPGYPEMIVVPPSGEVNPGALTPVTPDTLTPQVMPSPGRPGIASPIMVEAVTRHLSTQIGVPVDEVMFVAAASQTWPDGGLGCPAVGAAYSEAQVEGMLLTLPAGGRDYTYHTDESQNFVLCIDGERISDGAVP
mgnify:CR=1 FL=1